MKPETKTFAARLIDWIDRPETPLDAGMTQSQTAQPGEAFYGYSESENRHLADEQAEEIRIEHALEAWNAEKGSKINRILYGLFCFVTVLALMGVMLYTIAFLPEFGSSEHPINNEVYARYVEKGLQETGAVNIVTGMILDYRAFDTLGESTVLFTAAMVVLLLLRMDKESARFSPLAKHRSPLGDHFYEPKHDAILQTSVRFLVPIVLLLGIYVVLNGHLSPGGGFSGGAIMGAALIMHVTAFGFEDIHRFFTYKRYQRIVLVSLMTYACSKCYSFYTGANHIESIIPLGTPGAILSSGLILVLNICVGFIVTCTMFCFYAVFRKGEL